MKRYLPKMLGLITLLLVGVFVGMEWTQSGIERVYGPLDGTVDKQTIEAPITQSPVQAEPIQKVSKPASDRVNEAASPNEIWVDIDSKQVKYVLADSSAVGQDGETRRYSAEQDIGGEYELQAPADDAPINQIANQTAGLLQRLSEAGIKAVVGLFGSIF